MGKGVKYKGDLAKIVHEYLLRSYPPADVAWVLDPGISWEYEPTVKLADINMARRPGGRNPEKVDALEGSMANGASMDPVVLADTDDPNGLTIADGWHRTLAAEKAGEKDVPAFIASGDVGKYVDLINGRMQAQSTSKLGKADLDRWMRKSLGSVKRGKSAAVPFDSETIPADLYGALSAALAAAQTPAQVRAMFEVLGAAE
jgi:hypothetical protein